MKWTTLSPDTQIPTVTVRTVGQLSCQASVRVPKVNSVADANPDQIAKAEYLELHQTNGIFLIRAEPAFYL